MIIDFHFDNCGITLYINHDLTISSMKQQLTFIIKISEKEIKERIEKLWWDRFLKYCQTGK